MSAARPTPVTQDWADAFAAEWIAAWNARDLARILAHYAEDVVFASPFAVEFADGGVVRGKAALRAYWEKALAAFPDLRFVLHHALPGVDSVALVYDSVRELRAVETMIFGADDKVVRVHCHYQPRGD